MEKAVVTGYKAIESSVVSGYKAVEDTFTGGYQKIEDKFVKAFMTPDAESDDPKQTSEGEEPATPADPQERN
ncbi:MAG: hypothetical protein GX096_15325 [Clostridiales bacterium]|nr:hypothetical protein [Clostridiales bacterium]